MNLNEYYEWNSKFYPKWVKDKENEEMVTHWAILEMCGEAGEVLELAQKSVRRKKEVDEIKLKDELSDVFWGLTAILKANGWTYEELAQYNHDKLEARNA